MRRKWVFLLLYLVVVIPCRANQIDFNYSGKVDLSDFSILANAWMCQPGDTYWNHVCDISEPNDDIIDGFDIGVFAEDWLWKSSILLKIYSDGWGTLLDTVIVEEEGPVILFFEEENPYYDPPQYYVYASRQGYYTELYQFTGMCNPLGCTGSIVVDLDPIVPGKFNGTIFMTSSFFCDSYLTNTDVNVTEDPCGVPIAQFQTDEQGRFATDPLPEGYYYFEYNLWWDEPQYHQEEAIIDTPYQDFQFPSYIQALKPNIYLYPEEQIELDVHISFPHGGQIAASEPPYGDGWRLVVEPSGLINEEYEFLFYESFQPDYGQYDSGWVLAREKLETFFRNNMAQTSFNEAEIDDFIEYWMPRLIEYPYYAIYPQYNEQLAEMIKLEFSVEPQSLIRLIYSVRGLESNNLTIQEPTIPSFAREGFTVTEWGVILK
jgi:hypothetical protein